MRERIWALARTLVFLLLVPGSVGVLIPELIVRAAGAREPAAGGFGLALALVGAALVLWAGVGFAFVGRGTPNPADAPRELVTWGPYRWVRNPMYVGVLLMIVAQAAAESSAALLAYAVLVFAVVHAFVVLYEEPTLRRRFGASYDSYLRDVPRWIPRPPR